MHCFFTYLSTEDGRGEAAFHVVPIDGTCVMVHTMMSDLLFRHETLANTALPLPNAKPPQEGESFLTLETAG